MRLYFDANLLIYAVEGIEPWVNLMRQLLASVDRRECAAITSELTLAECLVKPFEEGREDLVQVYLDLIRDRETFELAVIDRNILIEAARLRAATRLKLPDAIHAATAISRSCNLLLTNDPGFRAVGGIETRLLSELG